MHEARALNAYLLAELDRSRAGTDVPLDTCATLKEGGQGLSKLAPQAARSAFPPLPEMADHLTWPDEYAILVKRARQSAKRFKGNR